MLKRLLCKHKYEWVRDIYGDEVRQSGWKRSIWQCSKCNKVKYMEDLHDNNAVL
jgi:hypothetical protein